MTDFFTFYTRPHKLVSFYYYRVKTLLQKEESSATKPVHDVSLFTSPRQTWSAASALLPCMAWLPRNVIQSEVSIHATCSNLICCKTGLKVGGKTVNIAFELSNISKQIARTDVLATHMANLPTFIFILLFIVFWGAESSMIKVLLFSLEIETPVFQVLKRGSKALVIFCQIHCT